MLGHHWGWMRTSYGLLPIWDVQLIEAALILRGLGKATSGAKDITWIGVTIIGTDELPVMFTRVDFDQPYSFKIGDQLNLRVRVNWESKDVLNAEDFS